MVLLDALAGSPTFFIGAVLVLGYWIEKKEKMR